MRYHFIVRHQNELALVDAVVKAVDELGDIRKRANHLVLGNEILTPATLRHYLATHVAFSRVRKPIAPPWSIVETIIERARSGEVPVREVER